MNSYYAFLYGSALISHYCVPYLRLKNVMFDISPTEEVGDFEVKAKFMGVEMEKVQLHFQVNVPKNVHEKTSAGFPALDF